MDRLLTTVRDTAKQGRRRTMINTPLRKSIAVRTFGDWHDPSPGFFEMDMVVHCGKSGRDFNAHDTLHAPLVAVINESMASKFFGSNAEEMALDQFHRSFTIGNLDAVMIATEATRKP